MPARTWLVLGLSICFCEFPCSAQRSNPFGSHGGFGRADVPWDLRRWPGRLSSHLHNGLVRLYRDLFSTRRHSFSRTAPSVSIPTRSSICTTTSSSVGRPWGEQPLRQKLAIGRTYFTSPSLLAVILLFAIFL